MQFLLSSTVFSLIYIITATPIEGEVPAKNEVVGGKIAVVENDNGMEVGQHSDSMDNKSEEGVDQPIIHKEPEREFIPIHKRDVEHKPAAESEVPSMNSDVEQQPKSPFDDVNDDSEKTKLRSVRRVGKKKVTPRPTRD